jgi:quercetin dioxygenase-like cupin family protein
MEADGRIYHQSELEKYAPPGHTGTANVRLVEKGFCGAFEMVLGEIEPGCEAHRHAHDVEAQVCYVIEGKMAVSLGSDGPVTCGPGSVVTIPPKVDHLIVSTGPEPLKLIVLYSPPLPPRGDVAIGG